MTTFGRKIRLHRSARVAALLFALGVTCGLTGCSDDVLGKPQPTVTVTTPVPTTITPSATPTTVTVPTPVPTTVTVTPAPTKKVSPRPTVSIPPAVPGRYTLIPVEGAVHTFVGDASGLKCTTQIREVYVGDTERVKGSDLKATATATGIVVTTTNRFPVVSVVANQKAANIPSDLQKPNKSAVKRSVFLPYKYWKTPSEQITRVTFCD